MDLGSFSLSVRLMMLCLLGAARCSNGENCPCPEIPAQLLTESPPQKCHQINSTFRYKCIEGYVRKAGTSNLIKCNLAGVPVWSKYKLSCIPDPNRTTTQRSRTTVTKEHTVIPHISTTTVTPSTSQQITQSASISASVTAETESTEPTSAGLWSLSDHNQGKTLVVTHESVTVTREAVRTTSTSTLSLSTVNNNNTLIHEFSTGLNSPTVAVVACVSLVIIIAMIGISLLYYRRKSTSNMPLQAEEEEVIPMNHVPSGPA